MDELKEMLEKFQSMPIEVRQAVAAIVSGEAVDPAKVTQATAARKKVLAARWQRLKDMALSYAGGVDHIEVARRDIDTWLKFLDKLQPDIESAAAELGVSVPRLGGQTESIAGLIRTADTRPLFNMIEALVDEVQRGDARQ